MPTPPSLTAEQRAQALRRAAKARAVRAAVKADLKAGRTTVSRVFADARTVEPLASLRVKALLEALPGYGTARAAAVLAAAGIAETRRIRGLGPNQRTALLAAIGQTAESPS